MFIACFPVLQLRLRDEGTLGMGLSEIVLILLSPHMIHNGYQVLWQYFDEEASKHWQQMREQL